MKVVTMKLSHRVMSTLTAINWLNYSVAKPILVTVRVTLVIELVKVDLNVIRLKRKLRKTNRSTSRNSQVMRETRL